jgi:error-prone DNA polymerase
MSAPVYAELQASSNFSFLRGASHPQELVETAQAKGLEALALTDHNTLAGVVRAHSAAKTQKLAFIVGCQLTLTDAPPLLCLPTNLSAYSRLCRLLTLGKRRARKGQCLLSMDDLTDAWLVDQIVIVLPPEAATPPATHVAWIRALAARSAGAVFQAGHHHCRGDDRARLARLAEMGAAVGAPLVATNDVHYHHPDRRPLQDILTCIREHCTIDEAGFRLLANAERHIKSPAEMAALFADHPEALLRTVQIAERCRFSLDDLSYDYPEEPIPKGRTAQQHLEILTWEGAARRFPQGVSAPLQQTLRRELQIIGQLNYAAYFLTVHDIVRVAEEKGILCQGRGSAANSAVCFMLGITNVDPTQIDLLFDRFVSEARNEPPDIDVDFEHERREEIIQDIYQRYGRHRAGLAATVITYRGRSAVREVGKAMGLSEDITTALAGLVWGSWGQPADTEQVVQAGLDPTDTRLAHTIRLTHELIGFPRHLSQHVGGFVLTRGALEDLVPIGNAAMDDRTFIEWDKDDINTLKIMKVDVLALGMLSCIRKAFVLLAEHYNRPLTLATVPREDPATYDMLCRADSIGVFQVESRAQMNMLPRLRPRIFYDLVIEVAIVRPGPIQGDMVHPYLRRRDGLEAVAFPSPHPYEGPPDELARVLAKTLGVPLFQEQAMRIAIEAAKFSPEEVNELRYAMATFRRRGTIHQLEEKMVGRMIARGYDPAFAQRCFEQIKGFGEYGFPESHAASFAHLVYVSAWLKCHYPAAFAAALLNAQPMGFYAPAQIVGDARAHGVEVRAVDVNFSAWDCTLEAARGGHMALRLGLRQVDGLSEVKAGKMLVRRAGGYNSVEAVQRRGGLDRAAIEALARADGFGSLGLDRRKALWAAKALVAEAPLPLFAAADTDAPLFTEPEAILPATMPSEAVMEDYKALRLSLKAHPVSFLRAGLREEGVMSAQAVAQVKDGRKAIMAGLVLIRQRPGTASGVIFATLEDETGVTNVVIWPSLMEQYRKVIMGARLLLVRGRVQRTETAGTPVVHLVAEALEDRSAALHSLLQGLPVGASAVLGPAGGAQPPPRHQAPMPARHPRDQRVMPKSRDFH